MRTMFLRNPFLITGWLVFMWGACMVPAWGQTVRPTSETLLPETTVAYIQLRDFREFVEDMKNSNMGRMLADERVAPLVDELYGQARDAFTDFQDEIGLAWDDLEGLPSGEICFAVIAPRRADAQFVLIMDVNPDTEAANNILNRVDELATENGAEIENDEEGEVAFKTIMGPEVNLTQFRIENTIVVTNDRMLSEEIVERWMGRPVDKVRPLSENRKFVTIMNRCRGTKEALPEMRFFVDPIALVRAVTRGDVGAQTALNFLPLLGLDGLLGIGGAALFDEMEFESVTHMHILMANPRAGILEMMALKPGNYQPEPWVNEEMGNYISINLDAPKMFAELTKIVNGFMGEEAFEKQIEENVNSELELDFVEDVIGSLSGRLTLGQWVEQSEAMNAQSNAFGVGLKDVEKARMVLEKIKARIERDNNSDEERILMETYKGIDFWRVNTGDAQERLRMRREEGELRVNIRAPEPCFGIIGESFVFCDNRALFELCIDTFDGNANPLAENEEFLNVADRINRLLGTDMPAGVFYSQPGPTIEWLLKLASGDDARSLLEENAGDNKYLGRLRDGLEKNPLPTYEDVKDYFKPSGGFFTADDTGYHWLQFQIRADK